jgi:hypothetical protein
MDGLGPGHAERQNFTDGCADQRTDARPSRLLHVPLVEITDTPVETSYVGSVTTVRVTHPPPRGRLRSARAVRGDLFGERLAEHLERGIPQCVGVSPVVDPPQPILTGDQAGGG